MPEDIITRLLDLDSRAEAIHEDAKRQVEAIKAQTLLAVEQARRDLDGKIARGAAEIEAREAETRRANVAEVESALAAEAARVRSTGETAIRKAVDSILRRARE